MQKGKRVGLVFAIFALLFLGACRPKKEDVSQTISFQAKYGNENLELNKVYATTAGDSLRFSTAKIYLSNLELLKSDGSSLLLNAIVYFSLPEVLNVTTQKIPEGNYTGIRFNFGLTDVQNSFDSTSLSCPNPLCVDNDMWWDETLKYTFVKLEGGVKKQGENEFSSLVYHVGTSDYRRTIVIEHPIVVTNEEIDRTIVLDVQEILDGANPMNFTTERTTKTFDKPEVAAKFADNIVNAFSVQ